MSIINDALKKTQLKFMKPKKKEKAQSESESKPKDDGTVNVYEKMYKDREEKQKSSGVHVISEKRSSKDGKSKDRVPGRSKEWLKTIFATIFLIASVAFSYTFLSSYEPLQQFLRSTPLKIGGKKRSSRAYIMKHMPKKRTYKAGDLVLNGISVIDGEKVVLINDEIYQVGDVVNKKRITNIGKTEVELRDDEKIYTIKVR